MELASIFCMIVLLLLESHTCSVACTMHTLSRNFARGSSCTDNLTHLDLIPLSLLQRGSEKQMRFKPAGWFGGFSESESTFDRDVVGDRSENPESSAEWQNGLEIHSQKGFAARWFHESASGGKDAAWQTHFPAVTDSEYRDSLAPPWQRTTRGHWQQRFKAPAPLDETDHPMSKGVSWFDSSVDQFDAYGRQRAPQDSVELLRDSLQPFEVNTTLRCKEPGCTANSTLQVSRIESLARCHLSFWVYPTDFDDEHSREEVEWVTVNGLLANMHCDPMARGCRRGLNEASPAQRFTCLQGYDVTELLKKANGTLMVAAKISKMVDECEIEGNLLSGGADLQCLMQKPTTTSTTTTLIEVVPEVPVATSGSSVLRCRKPGCTARAVVFLNNASIDNTTTCYLTVQVRPTDFDKIESKEEVEWIKADDKEIQKSCKPNGSPCRINPNATNYGQVAPFECISNLDVTNASRDGRVIITAKISDMVDECDYNGFLLYGKATVRCTPPQISTTTMVPENTVNTTSAAKSTAEVAATTTASTVAAPASTAHTATTTVASTGTAQGTIGSHTDTTATEAPAHESPVHHHATHEPR